MRSLKALLVALTMGAAMFAACPGGRFDVSIREPISLKDALLSIVDECDISLSIEGEGSQTQFDSAKIGYVSLRAVSAEEAIEFFLQRANLHHTIVNDVLTIRYLDTKLFRVDFVNNSRTGTSNADVKIGTSTSSSSSTSSSTGSSSDSSSSIKTEEKFDFWGTLDKELAAILHRPEDGVSSVKGGEEIVINPASGLVTVTGTRRQIDRISEYLDKTIATLKKQVLIDTQIYEVTLNDDHTSGIDWSALSLGFDTRAGNWGGTPSRLGQGPGSNQESGGWHFQGGSDAPANNRKTFTFTADYGWNANGFINFLKTQGEAKSLSSPKVLAMNNQPTLISVGRNLNYQTLSSTTLSGNSSGQATQSVTQDSLFVGVLLDITAQIDDDGFVTLRLNPSISDLLHATDELVERDASGIVPRRIAPDTMSRRISSVARVRDGDVVVLGGMIQSSNEVNENKVPLLGDIPFLGALFGSKRTNVKTTEIVFVLTPHIQTDTKDALTLQKLGFGKTIIGEVNSRGNAEISREASKEVSVEDNEEDASEEAADE